MKEQPKLKGALVPDCLYRKGRANLLKPVQTPFQGYFYSISTEKNLYKYVFVVIFVDPLS